jgi:hypothetical protein
LVVHSVFLACGLVILENSSLELKPLVDADSVRLKARYQQYLAMGNYERRKLPDVSQMAIAPWVAQVYGDDAALPNQLFEEATMVAT